MQAAPSLHRPHAGGIGITGDFGGNRQEFAAIESEIAQRASIEAAQSEVSGSRMLLPLPLLDQSARVIGDRLECRLDNLP